jgi:hypothetical protein
MVWIRPNHYMIPVVTYIVSIEVTRTYIAYNYYLIQAIVVAHCRLPSH